MVRAMESLMSIGRFARLTGLTVKALRHYDELGLLRPAAVDPETGYRSYSSAQLGRAEAIRLLRRLPEPLYSSLALNPPNAQEQGPRRSAGVRSPARAHR